MGEFNDFIETTGLVDIRLVNRRFTWYRPDGTSMSRLDRFLLSTEMCNMSGEWVQHGVLDAWQQHPDFKKTVEEKWATLKVEGFAGFRCKQKLKLLKECLRGWNKGVFGDMEAQFDNAVQKVEHVDMRNEEYVLEGFEVAQRQEAFQELWEIIRKRENIWRQKARCNWLKMGDANTRYFHKVANGRKAHNGITGLFSDGRWVEEPELVKKLVVKYFRELFQGESWSRPKPEGVTFKQITKEQQEWLERPFSVEEIEEGLKSCDGNKALGPDGFNFNFIKFVWSSLKEDFVSFFEEFHQRGLCGLVKKAEMEGLLHGIEVGKRGLAVSLLQFADDTVILGRADSQNVFMVKSILRWFELMSGLRINFRKSSVYGLNVSEMWLKGAATAFSYGVGEFPFIYLGLPVGGNPRNKKLWSTVVKKFRAKLAIWKSAVLSFGGRLTLLNSVLRDKYYGGKEVVDITAVDTWQLSKIWEDVIHIGGISERLRNMLVKGFKWEVNDGRRVGFWRDSWVGDKPLRDLCPRLYALSTNREGMVSEMGDWERDRWCWSIAWRRERRSRERDEEELLMKLLGKVRIKIGGDDGWRWVHDSEGNYVVKKAYEFLAPLELVGKEMGACMFLIVSWYLWYWRNAVVFQHNGSFKEKLLDMVQIKSFSWIKSKHTGVMFSFHEWTGDPVACALEVRRHKKELKRYLKLKQGHI
ncbi:hypothetical protein SLEP1_g7507 [Rubroshorea leprosula]|uniref:Reverse transcriptase domain-containing protein n=1 Tax=Rubroshorea leprosula TaxID=152421 RepID=A0AAV5I7N1_9ROSI|nr:hypothetical protein SLEP1_g7507 [Rubroshorea leprosula]